MTLIINPFIELKSTSDRDKYLSLVRDVALETQANEPECLAYCWTFPVPEPENAINSPAFVQGIEIYKTPEALTITHRSSNLYKTMREVVAANSLISPPKGGIPMYVPAGAGFLGSRGASEMVTADDYFIFIQYTAHGKENVHSFLKEEQLLNEQLKSTEGVLAMWCFVPGDTGEHIPITIFVRLLSIDYLKNVQDKIRRFEDKVVTRGAITQTRLWTGQGFGFVRNILVIE